MKRIPIIVISCLTVSHAVVAQHTDVMPVSVIGNPSALEIGAFDFGAFAVAQLPPVRVYENDLEEPVPGSGILAGEAGFSSLGATTAASLLSGTGYSHLPGGAGLRFDFRSFSAAGDPRTANLWYWDGVDANGNGDFADDVALAPSTDMLLSFERDAGLFSSTVDGGAGPVSGFLIGSTSIDDPGTADDETGFLHVDLDALLTGAAGQAARPGIYAVSLQLSHAGAEAAPFFWVFNAGLGEEGEEAVEAAMTVVPEPATAMLTLVVAAVLAARRRSGSR